MSDHIPQHRRKPELRYVGPSTPDANRPDVWIVRIAKAIPASFLLFVVLPSILAFVYYYVIAAPIYVSEAKFVVRQTQQQQLTSIGAMLQSAGVTSSQSDSSAVHEYMKSPAALTDIQRRIDVPAALDRPEADVLSKFPRPWEKSTTDSLIRGLNRFVVIGRDSGSGMSTLRVMAFRPQDAQTIANALLDGGERLVNRLNDRSNSGAIAEATRNVADAEQRVTDTQTRLTSFRNRERIVDPTQVAIESSELVGKLLAEVASMRAERTQLQRSAPESPNLAILNDRIAAYEGQIDAERTKLAGDATSLAPKMAQYEALTLEREYAARALTSARTSLDTARVDARRQRLYLDRVVPPNLPTDPTMPRRGRALLTIISTLLLVYGTGWLIVAGVREHRLG